jgi:hypothetical protein
VVRRRSTVRFRNGAPQELPVRPGQKLTGQLPPYAVNAGRHPADQGPQGHAEPPGNLRGLAELDYPILDTEIPLAEYPYAVGFGSAPVDFGAYDDLLMELKP